MSSKKVLPMSNKGNRGIGTCYLVAVPLSVPDHCNHLKWGGRSPSFICRLVLMFQVNSRKVACCLSAIVHRSRIGNPWILAGVADTREYFGNRLRLLPVRLHKLVRNRIRWSSSRQCRFEWVGLSLLSCLRNRSGVSSRYCSVYPDPACPM